MYDYRITAHKRAVRIARPNTDEDYQAIINRAKIRVQDARKSIQKARVRRRDNLTRALFDPISIFKRKTKQ